MIINGTQFLFGSAERRPTGWLRFTSPEHVREAKLGRKTDLVADLKWLPELGVNRRLEGDHVWFKLALVF